MNNLQTERSPRRLNEKENEGMILHLSNSSLCQKLMEMMCENFENIAHQNEAKKQNDGLRNMTAEDSHLRNCSAPFKIVQDKDLENMKTDVRRVNQTITNGVLEITQLRMRVENIENKTKHQIEDLVSRVNQSVELTDNAKTDISNQIRNLIADLRSEVKDSLSSTERKMELLLNNTKKQIQELEKRVHAAFVRVEPSPPVILNLTSKSSYVAKEGEPIALVCESKTVYSPDKLEWFIDEINITDKSIQTDRLEEQMTMTWIATSVLEYIFHREHNGKMLRCLATLTVNNEIHKREVHASLDILYKPKLHLRGKPTGTLTEGDRVVIRSIVDANPKATVVWKKSGSSAIYSIGEELKFSSIKQSDSGTYKCIAKNRIGESLESEVNIVIHQELCKLPILADPNMLMALESDEKGNERLVFSCKPLGKFILIEPVKPWKCVGKFWRGTFPTCRKLLEPVEVTYLASQLHKESICESGSSDRSDPTDCTSYFTCIAGKLHRKKCTGFFGEFNSATSSCVHFRYSDCPKDTSKETARLRDFIPAIHVVPDKVNKENSRMATDDVGRLVVFKGQSFSLSCNYPDNRWGPAHWIVDLFDSKAGKTSPTREASNQVIVDIKDASETDSGIYTCRTPFGKYNSIKVFVRVARCVMPQSEFLITSGRVKDLTFSIRYRCENGIEIKAFCKANGEWSRPPPNDEECSKAV